MSFDWASMSPVSRVRTDARASSYPRDKCYGFWETAGWALVIYGVSLYVTVLFSSAFCLIIMTTGNIDLDQATVEAFPIKPIGFVQALAMMALSGIGIAFTASVISQRSTSFTHYCQTRRTSLGSVLLFSLPIVAVHVVWVVGYSYSAIFHHTVSQFEKTYDFSRYPWGVAGAIILFGPAFEEYFWRGFVFTGFANSRLGTPGAIVLTALLFAGTHCYKGQVGMAFALAVGLYLGWVRNRKQSVFLPFALHATWNAFVFLDDIATSGHVPF